MVPILPLPPPSPMYTHLYTTSVLFHIVYTLSKYVGIWIRIQDFDPIWIRIQVQGNTINFERKPSEKF